MGKRVKGRRVQFVTLSSLLSFGFLFLLSACENTRITVVFLTFSGSEIREGGNSSKCILSSIYLLPYLIIHVTVTDSAHYTFELLVDNSPNDGGQAKHDIGMMSDGIYICTIPYTPTTNLHPEQIHKHPLS